MVSALRLTPTEHHSELAYYLTENETKPRAVINLESALVSNITSIKQRDYSFSIQTVPPNGKTYFMSFDTLNESVQWREYVIKAAKKKNPANGGSDSVKKLDLFESMGNQALNQEHMLRNSIGRP